MPPTFPNLLRAVAIVIFLLIWNSVLSKLISRQLVARWSHLFNWVQVDGSAPSPEFLSRALGVSIGQATTRQFLCRPTATIVVLDLQHDSPGGPKVPRSVAVKQSSSSDLFLQRLVSCLSFDSSSIEVKVLTQVLPLRKEQVDISPAVFHSAVNTRLRTFVLVMEDLTQRYHQIGLGEMVAQGRLEAVMRGLATLHSAFWEADRLLLTVPRDAPSLVCSLVWNKNSKNSKNTGGSALSADTRAFLALLRDQSPQISAFLSQLPMTLIHGSVHPGHIFFPLPTKRPPLGLRDLVLVDWRHSRRGFGMADVAAFLCLLPTDLRRQREESLITVYHKELVRRGDLDYPLQTAARHYRFGLLHAARSYLLLGTSKESEQPSADQWNAIVEDYQLLQLMKEIAADKHRRAS